MKRHVKTGFKDRRFGRAGQGYNVESSFSLGELMAGRLPQTHTVAGNDRNLFSSCVAAAFAAHRAFL
jgi:hypothetical protein